MKLKSKKKRLIIRKSSTSLREVEAKTSSTMPLLMADLLIEITQARMRRTRFQLTSKTHYTARLIETLHTIYCHP